jgi:hypothetical protein
VRGHAESINFMVSAVLIKLRCSEAAVTVENKQPIGT